MPLRREWNFQYIAREIADGARRKAEHHEERMAFWDAEIEAARDAIKASGVDIRSYDVTGGQRHEVVIDPSLANRLSEAQQKRSSHEDSAKEYRMWERVLEANGFEALRLDAADVDFFGLAEVEVPA
jgi:hypothetical protein